MTEWQFWGDRQILSVYGNIYLRTFVEDWFKIVETIASKVKGKVLLDLGCGEGHTTKQILDRVESYEYCDLVEPNRSALESAKSFLKFENKIGKVFSDTLETLQLDKKYDCIFTSHTNYYWASKEESYKKQLDKLISLVKNNGRIMILTLPEYSDHYNIMLHQVYPRFNYSSYIVNYYKSKGLKVEVVRFKMRMFVGDILTNPNLYDLMNFYKFIHNTNSLPSKSDALIFLDNIKRYQKKGYLDFKDELIIVDKD